MLQQVQEMQDLYAQWMKLLPELEKSMAQWKNASQILDRLQAFYFDPQWLELCETVDESRLTMQGNYSVLSQDAIWNALHDRRRLAIEWLKQIVAVLEND